MNTDVRVVCRWLVDLGAYICCVGNVAQFDTSLSDKWEYSIRSSFHSRDFFNEMEFRLGLRSKVTTIPLLRIATTDQIAQTTSLRSSTINRGTESKPPNCRFHSTSPSEWTWPQQRNTCHRNDKNNSPLCSSRAEFNCGGALARTVFHFIAEFLFSSLQFFSAVQCRTSHRTVIGTNQWNECMVNFERKLSDCETSKRSSWSSLSVAGGEF